MAEHTDRTAAVEEAVGREYAPKFSHLTRLFRYVFASARGICLVFFGLMVLLSFLRPALALLWGRYIDLASAHLPGGQILPMIGLLFGYYLINFFSQLIERYTSRMEQIERLDVVQTNRFQEFVLGRVLRKLSRLSPEYFEVPKINDMIKRSWDFVNNGWDGMSYALMIRGYTIIAKAVSVLTIALALWAFHPLLTLCVLLAPIPTLYTTYVGEKLKFRFVRDNAKLQREADYYQNLMLKDAVKEIKALRLFPFFFGKWKALMDEYTLRERKTQLRLALLSAAGGLIGNLASVAANIGAIALLTAGQLSIGALGAVMSLIGTLVSDTGMLFRAVAEFTGKKRDAAQFYELYDLPEEPQADGADEPFAGLSAQNLRYRYPLTDRYALDGVTLSIRPGEKVALVGENGAGKTTFVKLVTGMLTPSEGTILWNGRDAAETPAARRACMTAVFQEPVRYSAFTAGQNVLLGEPGAAGPEGGVEEALRFARLDIAPEQLLGKDVGGTELSGGQWQKLAIARGAYRKRGFLVLDEPTSNLDPLAEAEVFQRYIDMAAGSTVLIVTHRISVAALADRVIVFAGGRVAEDGTHEELLRRNGAYAHLLRTQSQWYKR